jgi:hypothetical protein
VGIDVGARRGAALPSDVRRAISVRTSRAHAPCAIGARCQRLLMRDRRARTARLARDASDLLMHDQREDTARRARHAK